MRKLLVIGAIALGLVAGTSIFISCKKGETTSSAETQISDNEAIRKLSFGAEISKKGHKGSGKGKDKTCVDGSGRCWLWGSAEMDEDIRAVKVVISVVFNCISGDDDDDDDGGGGGNGNGEDNHQNLILDFRYDCNTAIALNEILGTNRVLVIEEDIVEDGDSYLLELIGTTLPCTIPAGSYIGTIHEEGITVIVPVYKSGDETIIIE